jgi:hypothetical protein
MMIINFNQSPITDLISFRNKPSQTQHIHGHRYDHLGILMMMMMMTTTTAAAVVMVVVVVVVCGRLLRNKFY